MKRKAVRIIVFIAVVIAFAGCQLLVPDLSNEDITVDHDVLEDDMAMEGDAVRPDTHDDTHDNPDAVVDAADLVDAPDLVEDSADVIADDIGEEEYECLLPEHCTDGDICNGDETCDPDSHTCVEGLARDDGFLCGAGPRKICLEEECLASLCGDGFIDEGGGEFCEPPDVGGCDGECKLGCDGPEDCPGDGDVCNGEEYCNTASHTCDRRTVPVDGTGCGGGNVCCGGECLECCDESHCGDANPCTRDVCTLGVCSNPAEEDGTVCEGSNMCCTGVCRECCAHTDCNDLNPCTNDTCSAGGVCSNTVVDDRTPCGGGNVCCSGVCEECCVPADCDDGNQCTYERCNSNNCVNRDEDDMMSCSGGSGVCCNGTCRDGGECCADTDCLPRCRGTATACSSYGTSGDCLSQAGCAWDPAGPCGGDGKECVFFDFRVQCVDCDCIWDDGYGICEGGSVECNSYSTEASCSFSCGCTWDAGGPCSGTAAACSGFSTQSSCNGQDGCGWIFCSSYECR